MLAEESLLQMLRIFPPSVYEIPNQHMKYV